MKIYFDLDDTLLVRGKKNLLGFPEEELTCDSNYPILLRPHVKEVLLELHKTNELFVWSSSSKQGIIFCLMKTNIYSFFKGIFSNEDIYDKKILRLISGNNPDNSLLIEDSYMYVKEQYKNVIVIPAFKPIPKKYIQNEDKVMLDLLKVLKEIEKCNSVSKYLCENGAKKIEFFGETRYEPYYLTQSGLPKYDKFSMYRKKKNIETLKTFLPNSYSYNTTNNKNLFFQIMGGHATGKSTLAGMFIDKYDLKIDYPKKYFNTGNGICLVGKYKKSKTFLGYYTGGMDASKLTNEERFQCIKEAWLNKDYNIVITEGMMINYFRTFWARYPEINKEFYRSVFAVLLNIDLETCKERVKIRSLGKELNKDRLDNLISKLGSSKKTLNKVKESYIDFKFSILEYDTVVKTPEEIFSNLQEVIKNESI